MYLSLSKEKNYPIYKEINSDASSYLTSPEGGSAANIVWPIIIAKGQDIIYIHYELFTNNVILLGGSSSTYKR